MTDARRILAERVARLDQRPSFANRQFGFDSDLAHFVQVMDAIVPPGSPIEAASITSAALADEVIDTSRLINRILAKAPEIVVGPLARAEQYWVATERPSHLPARLGTLGRTSFVEASTADKAPPSTKPFEFGLYTSTGALGTWGMWWCLLQLSRGSTLFPFPWKIWSVSASEDAKVLEITTAQEWVDLVSREPVYSNKFLYPNWTAVSEQWDAVHVTARAVAATQGIRFSVGNSTTAPAYWGVESTLWLRWAFAAIELLQVLEDVASPD